jgi:hypothetical protein
VTIQAAFHECWGPTRSYLRAEGRLGGREGRW